MRLLQALVVVVIISPSRTVGQSCSTSPTRPDRSTVVSLMRRSFDQDSVRAAQAWQTLVTLDSTGVRNLLSLMCDDVRGGSLEDMTVRVRAGGVLLKMGPRGIRALVTALADSNRKLSGNAAMTLLFEVYDTLNLNAQLLPLLTDPRPYVRTNVIELVRLDGALQQDAITAMRKALVDPDESVRRTAAGRLAEVGLLNAPLQSDLVRALADRAPDVRRAAALALGRGGAADPHTIRAITSLLHDDRDPTVRQAAADALGSLEEAGEPAVPVLIAALRDRAPSVRASAAGALGEIGASSARSNPDSISDALSAALADGDRLVRLTAARALRTIGAPAARHQLRALRNADYEVRTIVVSALGELPATSESIEGLISLLNDPNEIVRGEVIGALGGFGHTVEPRMQVLATSSDEMTRNAARQVLDYVERIDRSPVANACYELQVGAWMPSLDIRGDTIFAIPPRTIQFSPLQFEYSGDQQAFKVLPIRGAESVHSLSYWSSVAGSDSVIVGWSNGFSGLSMRLLAKRDSLQGIAETFWDFPRPTQTAMVTGSRISCK